MPRTSKKSLISHHREFIKFLKDIHPSSRKKILANCHKNEIDCLSEIFANFLKKILTTNKKIINSLRPHKAVIRHIALKKTPLKKKKKILTSNIGGSILSLLLPLATSLLGGLLK